jgi:hypothetical protein
VAAGLKKRLEVQLYAGDLGPFGAFVYVRTEREIFKLPVRALVAEGTRKARSATIEGRVRSPHHIPPLTSGRSDQRFGATGSVRLFQTGPTPATVAFLEGRPVTPVMQQFDAVETRAKQEHNCFGTLP